MDAMRYEVVPESPEGRARTRLTRGSVGASRLTAAPPAQARVIPRRRPSQATNRVTAAIAPSAANSHSWFVAPRSMMSCMQPDAVGHRQH